MRIANTGGSLTGVLVDIDTGVPTGGDPSVSRALKLGQQTRTYARHWTPVHLDFVVSDIKSAVAQAQAAGATLEGEPETHNWGHIAHMADPFGHGICLIEFRGRGYDEIATPA